MTVLNREKIATANKFYIKINNNCNNNCLFCLDADNQNKPGPSQAYIEREITRGRQELGADKLIISGGEATIDPNFLSYVKLGKKLGYTKIQVITNGRMFAYADFAQEAIKSGLNEITFSIHGHTPDLYEKLTNILGSFKQILQALRNVRQYPEVIVNIDIVINKYNYQQLLEIINFYSQEFGIFEYDLLEVIPFGRAYHNRTELFFDLDEAWPYLEPVFKLAATDPRFYIWTNRFPVKYLEGYEILIQDPHKLLDEIRGREQMFTEYLFQDKPLHCADDWRCQHCYLSDFCQKLKLYKDKKEEPFFELASWLDFKPGKKWFVELDKKAADQAQAHWFKTKELFIKLKTYGTLAELTKESLALTDFQSLIKGQNLQFFNVPFCQLSDFKQVAFDFLIKRQQLANENGQLDLNKFAQHYINNLFYVKAAKCSQCKYDQECGGWHINYIRQYGFKVLKPFKS